MPTKLTNRVVLALHAVFIIATAAVVFVTAIQGSLPKAWGPSIAFGIGIVSAVAGATVAVTKYLQGSQQMDAIAGNKELQTAQHEHEHRLAVLNAVGRDGASTSETPNLPENAQADTGQVPPSPFDMPAEATADEEQGPPDGSALPESLDPVGWLAAPPDGSALPENLDPAGWLAARKPTVVEEGE